MTERRLQRRLQRTNKRFNERFNERRLQRTLQRTNASTNERTNERTLQRTNERTTTKAKSKKQKAQKRKSAKAQKRFNPTATLRRWTLSRRRCGALKVFGNLRPYIAPPPRHCIVASLHRRSIETENRKCENASLRCSLFGCVYFAVNKSSKHVYRRSVYVYYFQ